MDPNVNPRGARAPGARIDPRAGNPAVPVRCSAELFAGGRELCIDHQGRRYLLQVTRLGKLILTR